MDVAACQVEIGLGCEPTERASRSTPKVKHGLSLLVGDRVADALVNTEPQVRKCFLAAVSRGKGVGTDPDPDHQVIRGKRNGMHGRQHTAAEIALHRR